MDRLALVLPGGQPVTPPRGVPQGIGSGQNLLQATLTIAFLIGISLAIIFIIYAGIQWAMSGGDKQKLQQARLKITFSIIGLVVILAAFFIVRVVFALLGGGGSIGLFFPNS